MNILFLVLPAVVVFANYVLSGIRGAALKMPAATAQRVR